MNIEELAVTLLMLGYTYKINDDKTSMYMYLKNDLSFNELKKLLDTNNFYYTYYTKSYFIIITKNNEFNWISK